jgi:serine/threonine protein kinase
MSYKSRISKVMYGERIILNNYSKGSFGNIFKDAQSNIYKVTKISEDGSVTASNINEIIIFNFLKKIKKILLEADKNKNKHENICVEHEDIYIKINDSNQQNEKNEKIPKKSPIEIKNSNIKNNSTPSTNCFANDEFNFDTKFKLNFTDDFSEDFSEDFDIYYDKDLDIDLDKDFGTDSSRDSEIIDCVINSVELNTNDINSKKKINTNFDEMPTLNNTIKVDKNKKNFETLINENIFMQSLSTNYYNYEILQKKFIFRDPNIITNYYNYLAKNIHKFLIFSKLPNYQLNLSNFIEKYHVYVVDNFDIIAKKLLKSLALLHNNGFLHGDLKSSNILINDVNNLCLTDFGAVKISNFDKYHLSCTICSRCPEDLIYQYDTTKYFSNSNYKSDIWSLGLIFTEMILGFNPMLKMYQSFNKNKKDSSEIEKKLIEYYKSIKYIDVTNLVKINPIKNHLTSKHYEYITVIENMLKINPDERLSYVEEVYQKLFGEKIELNFKINFDYQYTKYNIGDKFEKLFFLRKQYYKNIISICDQLNILYVSPLVIDILDRLFITVLDKIINDIVDLHACELNLIFAAAILLASGIINQSHPRYSELLQVFGIKYDSLNIGNINNNLIEILELLNYDIYRPFNIFYCPYLLEFKNCECISENKTVEEHIYNSKIITIHNIEQKNNLISTLNNLIDNNIIGISPNYYYEKLSPHVENHANC